MPAVVEAVRQSTGLVVQGEYFAGHFQGYRAWARTRLLPSDGGPVYHSSPGGSGDMGYTLHKMRYSFGAFELLLHFEVGVEVAGKSFPASSLRDRASIAGRPKGPQPRAAMGSLASTGLPWIDQRFEVASFDPQFIQRCCASPELQRSISQWPQLNLYWSGANVGLEILMPTLRFAQHFAGTQYGELEMGGLSLVIAAARAAAA